MIIRESAEMYLETILVLEKRLGRVRSIDVVNETGFSRPTISEQMKRFRENGYITMDQEGAITLTEEGRALAEHVLERHHLLSRMLMAIGVDEETALADACRIEHYISETTFERLRAHFELHQKKQG